MEIIDNQPDEQGRLAEPEPRYHTASLPVERTEQGHSWVQVLGVIIAGVILVILLVLLARWVYHKSHNKVVRTPTTSQSSETGSAVRPQSGAQSAAGASNNSASTNTSGSASNAQKSSTTTSSSGLPNTGAGNVAGLFVGASLTAAGLHYIVSVRRSARKS